MASSSSTSTEPSSDQPEPANGVLLVTSDTISPQTLPREDFDYWYTTTHIPLVLTTGKGQIGTATRYQYIPYSSTKPSHPLDAPDIPLRQLSFLTVYDLQDVGWVKSDAFKELAKENDGPYRDAVFRNADFDARTYVHRLAFDDDVFDNPLDKPPPAGIILTIMLTHAPGRGRSDEDMQEWYQDEHLPFFSRIAGYRTSRMSQFQGRSRLRGLKKSEGRAPEWLVVHEFDGMRIPGIGFRDAESEVARLKEDVENFGPEGGEEDGKEGREVQSAFWSLMGEYWANDG